MATKQGTNSPGGNKFTGSKKVVPKEFVPHGTNSLTGEKVPRGGNSLGNKIPSYTGMGKSLIFLTVV